MLKTGQAEARLLAMRRGLFSRLTNGTSLHWGMVLVIGLLSVVCCCCLDFCGDHDDGHAAEDHADHSFCHCHQTAANNASSVQRDVWRALGGRTAKLPSSPAFNPPDPFPATEAPPPRPGGTTQTGLILRSSRLLI